MQNAEYRRGNARPEEERRDREDRRAKFFNRKSRFGGPRFIYTCSFSETIAKFAKFAKSNIGLLFATFANFAFIGFSPFLGLIRLTSGQFID